MIKANINVLADKVPVLEVVAEGPAILLSADIAYLVGIVYRSLKADSMLSALLFRALLINQLSNTESPVWQTLPESTDEQGLLDVFLGGK